MRTRISAFVSGLLFSIGLGIGGMTDPAKVVGFLDVFGAWDPALVFVMGGAVAVYTVGYRLIVRRPGPVLGRFFALPTARPPDGRLLLGAATFGVGWGLGGLCPGPAITSLATGAAGISVFVACMLAGLFIVPGPKAAADVEPEAAPPGAGPLPLPSPEAQSA